jgi:hypothetical protein
MAWATAVPDITMKTFLTKADFLTLARVYSEWFLELTMTDVP